MPFDSYSCFIRLTLRLETELFCNQSFSRTGRLLSGKRGNTLPLNMHFSFLTCGKTASSTDGVYFKDSKTDDGRYNV